MSESGSNYNNNNASGDIVSWVVVFICLVVFWPLGLFLLLRKISFGAKKGSVGSGSRGDRYRQKYQQYSQDARSKYAAYADSYRYNQQAQARPQQQAAQTPGGDARKQEPAGGLQAPTRPAQSTNRPQQPYYAAQTPGRAQAAGGAKVDPGSGAGVRNGTPAGRENKKQGASKGLAVALTALAVVLGIMGVIFLSSGLSAVAIGGLTAGSLSAAIFGGFSLLGAAISAIVRGTVVRRARHYSKYAAVIGSRDVVSLNELSMAVGESSKKTRQTLQAMVDSGFYGDQAYIDSGLDSFVLSREAAEKARSKNAAAASPAEGEQTAPGNQYVAIINELHMLCSQTADPAICQKIERIEELTAKIFRIVEEKPEKTPQLRRFMNYYLPTTMKLLHSYQTLERQGIAGENITAAKQDIGRILDTLASGFEQQLDNLFKSDKLDISADIDVIENLMVQDGLTGDGGIMKTAGGH